MRKVVYSQYVKRPAEWERQLISDDFMGFHGIRDLAPKSKDEMRIFFFFKLLLDEMKI